MSIRVAAEKCWNHSAREAIARCPECGHSYCRECVVEHDDRLICAGCLAKMASAAATPKRQWSIQAASRLTGAVLGLLVAWFVFFSLGRMLLSVPDRFHADTLWNRAFSDSTWEDGQ